MADKILFVDDDPNILSGFQRTLRGRFQVETADGPATALQKLADADFAVVVSDYRMPNMSGVEFLSEAAMRWPDCVRVLLTGEVDTKAAGAAVNQGQIFRFLMKPCPPMILEKTLNAALTHHRMVSSEKKLLEGTLRGSMETLVELLHLAKPLALRKSQSLYSNIRELLADLHVDHKWEFELAGLLAEVGNVMVPDELLAKVEKGLTLSVAEQSLYLSRFSFAERLLARVPRLELAAKVIGAQCQPVPPVPSWQAVEQADSVALGSNLLELALRWSDYQSKSLPHSTFMADVKTLGIHPALVKAAENLKAKAIVRPTEHPHSVKASQLEEGMALEMDLVAKNGVLLLAKGQRVTATIIEYLHKRADYYGADEEVLVRPVAAEAD